MTRVGLMTTCWSAGSRMTEKRCGGELLSHFANTSVNNLEHPHQCI